MLTNPAAAINSRGTTPMRTTHLRINHTSPVTATPVVLSAAAGAAAAVAAAVTGAVIGAHAN